MQTSIPDLMGGDNRQITSTDNHLLDRKIADGFPLHSLPLIEGGNNSGKSVRSHQTMYGAMRSGRSVDLYTTGNTPRNYVRQMKPMSRSVSKYFAGKYPKVFPHDVVGFTWNKKERGEILPCLIHNIRNSSMVQVAII